MSRAPGDGLTKIERLQVAGVAAPILRGGKGRRAARIRIVGPMGEIVDELTPLELAKRMLLRAKIELDVIVEDGSGAYAKKITAVRSLRNGAGNYAGLAKIDEARRLRESGLSLRAIARETGLSKATVTAYVKRIDRSDALKNFHARRKADGRPIVPPWQKKRAKRRPA